jgi:probable HAF family extracellular repeat protein
MGGPVVGLGKLPGYPNGWHFASSAYAVSNDGRVVVGQAHSAEGLEAFRWTAQTGIVGLGDDPNGDFGSSAVDVSGDGSVVVGSVTTGAVQQNMAYRWTEATGFQLLGVLSDSITNNFSHALGVSQDGSIISGYSRGLLGNEGFIYTQADGMTGLGHLGAIDSFAGGLDISADGGVVIGTSTTIPNQAQAYRWTEADGIQGLGTLSGSTRSNATAISGNGRVIIGNSAGNVFYWTEETGMESLGRFPGTDQFIFANDINYDGTIIVGTIGSNPWDKSAVYWDEANGFRTLDDVLTSDYGLDLEGWHLADANGISADGQWIVGMAINPDGIEEAYLVNVPEPVSIVLWGIGGCAIVVMHQRRRHENHRQESSTIRSRGARLFEC